MDRPREVRSIWGLMDFFSHEKRTKHKTISAFYSAKLAINLGICIAADDTRNQFGTIFIYKPFGVSSVCQFCSKTG
jgi:hypothetical protein